MISEGSAYLDRSGRVLAADAEFRALLGLPDDDPTEAFRSRIEADPALASLLSGDGPDALVIAPHGDRAGCAISRVASEHGTLLRARASDGALPAPVLELVVQAVALSRLAGSVAHEVKNPLNAMALQLALLADKIGSADGSLATTCAVHLGSLKNQIGRINEVVRRYIDVADPAPAAGYDAGMLLTDVANLFAHEARRRRVALACEAPSGTVRVAGDPARAARMLLGLVWRAVSGTPQDGKLVARAIPSGAEAVVAIEHARGSPDPALEWIGDVVAAAARDMGGRLEESCRDGIVRAALVLPKERPL